MDRQNAFLLFPPIAIETLQCPPLPDGAGSGGAKQRARDGGKRLEFRTASKKKRALRLPPYHLLVHKPKQKPNLPLLEGSSLWPLPCVSGRISFARDATRGNSFFPRQRRIAQREFAPLADKPLFADLRPASLATYEALLPRWAADWWDLDGRLAAVPPVTH